MANSLTLDIHYSEGMYFSIFEMEAGDIEEILDIETQSFSSPWTKAMFRQELDLEWSKVFLVKKSVGRLKEIVGYICFWLIIDEVHILNLATHPDCRRNGIATSLINSCLKSSILAGAKDITLEVRKSNLPAISLYRQFGFEVKGIRARYYSDNREDAIIMWLDLNRYRKRLFP